MLRSSILLSQLSIFGTRIPTPSELPATLPVNSATLVPPGKDFQTFVREAAEVDRNRCDGVEEGYAALHVAPTGAPWTMNKGETTALVENEVV